MTPEEFKSKFQVGDILKQDGWEKEVKITAIGIYNFLGITDGIGEGPHFMDYAWIKVEPEKKPSEEIEMSLIGGIVTFTGSVSDFDKRKSAEYAHQRIDAIEKWLDDNWPKVVKK